MFRLIYALFILLFSTDLIASTEADYQGKDATSYSQQGSSAPQGFEDPHFPEDQFKEEWAKLSLKNFSVIGPENDHTPQVWKVAQGSDQL